MRFKCFLTALNFCKMCEGTMLSHDLKTWLASDHLQNDKRAVLLHLPLIRILVVQKNNQPKFHLLTLFGLDPICTSSSPLPVKTPC